MPKPNILFIMTDQLRWDALGCSGDWVRTPNLDRIAAEGIRFSKCATNSPVCIPARVSLATGRYPHTTGVWSNLPQYDMPAETSTWMQAIRNAGYRTSLFGKTHLHHHTGDLREREHLLHAYGLDVVDEVGGPRASAHVLSHITARWEQAGMWEAYKADYQDRFSTNPCKVRPSTLPLELYADVYVGQQAKQHIRNYECSEPWFCWVSFGGPHEPWDTPEPYASMYDPAQMPKPIPGEHGARCRPEAMRNDHDKAAWKTTPEEIASMRANYAGNVSLIDDQIGEILETVASRGELDNTVIVFTSDHGEMNGDHGLVYKSNFMNSSVLVPLLIRTPETQHSSVAGTSTNSPVELFDVGPTLVELAGGELGYQQCAKSLCPALKERGIGPREYAISEIHGEVMYMDRKWKLSLDTKGLPYLLFDLEKDPDELENLVDNASAAETVAKLRIKVQEHLIKTQVIL